MYKNYRHTHTGKVSRHSRGFTLLFASLIASLFTALGLAMFTIAQKELSLSSIGRDSQYAFYAADTGAECATYWDLRYDVFATATTSSTEVTCAGAPVQESVMRPDGVVGIGGATTTTFKFETNRRCVEVRVAKQDVAPFTTVESLGYNTQCDQTDSARRLERAVRAVF